MLLDTILLWGLYLLVVCLVFTVYEIGILLGTRIFGGTCIECDCGFGPVVVACTVRACCIRIRALPFPLGITIVLRDQTTGHLLIRRPLIVQLRRKYGALRADTAIHSESCLVTKLNGLFLPVIGTAVSSLLFIALLGASTPLLRTLAIAWIAPITCCTSELFTVWGSMFSGASLIVAVYNLLPVKGINDGALLLELIRTPRIEDLLAPRSSHGDANDRGVQRESGMGGERFLPFPH